MDLLRKTSISTSSNSGKKWIDQVIEKEEEKVLKDSDSLNSHDQAQSNHNLTIYVKVDHDDNSDDQSDSGSEETKEPKERNEKINSANYRSYNVQAVPFVKHSKYFAKEIARQSKMIGLDGNFTIYINDISVETFEFVNYWIHYFSSKLDKNNVINLLIASIKYEILVLKEQCIEFIDTKWIVDEKSFFEFLDFLDLFSNDNKNDTIIIINDISEMLKENKMFKKELLSKLNTKQKDICSMFKIHV